MDKPTLLNPAGSVLVSSPKQAQLNIQQLHKRAANIPPMVSQREVDVFRLTGRQTVCWKHAHA